MIAALPPNETKRLAALRRYQILDTPAEQAFDDFTFLASTLCATPVALMTLVDSDRQWFKSSVGTEISETPRAVSFCAHTILGSEVLVIEDTTEDERFAQNPFVTAAPHIRFYAAAPLIDMEGNGLGALCVMDLERRTLTPEQVQTMQRLLQTLARQIILQLEFRRTAADLAAALSDLKCLHGLLPICSHCKNVRNDAGYWESVESYVEAHSEADFSHGICPVCMQLHYPAVAAHTQAEGMTRKTLRFPKVDE
jgi:GAF domain-containing protein